MAQYDYVAPPQKRMRFDDAASSQPHYPYASSPTTTTTMIQLPGAIPSPYSFNAPQPIYYQHEVQPPMGTPGGIMGPPMGPPQRPVERPQQQQLDEPDPKEQQTDMNALVDVMFGTGVDLKAEEAFMQSGYRNVQASYPSNSQSSNTLTANQSFEGSQSFALPGFGPLSSQDPLSQVDVENEIVRKHREAAKAFAARQQSPLSNPFLEINSLRIKLQRKALDHNVRLNLEGVYVRTEEQQVITVASRVGTGGVGIVAPTPSSTSWITESATLGDVFGILSVAAHDRLRAITEDAYALARIRQSTSDGVVDPDWADLAIGQGKTTSSTAIPLSVSRTAWDLPESAISPRTTRKRPREDDEAETNAHRLLTPPTEPSPTPKPTKAFPNNMASTLRDKTRRERTREIARLDAREKRKKAASVAASGTTLGAEGSPATPTTPVLPELTRPINKREAAKAEKAARHRTEDGLRLEANKTAAMALGGGRKYGWVQAAGAVKRPVPALNAAAASGGGGGAKPAAAVQTGLRARDRNFGEWKESGMTGGGIQTRDLSHVLEMDGKATQALAKLLAAQSSSDRPSEREYGPRRPRAM